MLGFVGVSLAFLPLMRNPFGAPKAVVLSLAALLVALGFSLDSAARTELVAALRRSKLAWLGGALLAIACLATVTAIDVRQALLGSYPDYRGLLSMIAYALVGCGALVVWGRGHQNVLGRAAVVATLWVDLLALGQRFGALPSAPTSGPAPSRVSSTLGNSSNLGVFLVAMLPIVVWVALADKRRGWRIAAAAAAAIGAPALLWTLSRGAWLGGIAAAVVAGALVVLSSSRAPSKRALAIGAAVIVVLVIGASLTPTFAERASTLLDARSRTAQWRLSAWVSATEMTVDRPFLGYGPNTFRFAYPPYQKPGQVDGRAGYQIVEAAHNLELDTATSFGVLGLAALLAVFGVVGFVLLKVVLRRDERRAEAIALAASLAGAGVALQFHYVTMDTGPLLMVLLAGVARFELSLSPEPAFAPVLSPSARGRGALDGCRRGRSLRRRGCCSHRAHAGRPARRARARTGK